MKIHPHPDDHPDPTGAVRLLPGTDEEPGGEIELDEPTKILKRMTNIPLQIVMRNDCSLLILLEKKMNLVLLL